jgi:DNA-binding phage protein
MAYRPANETGRDIPGLYKRMKKSTEPVIKTIRK